MNWDELKSTWERQPLPEWHAPDLAALEREFATKQRSHARRFFWRDVNEMAASLLMAVVYGGIGWFMGPAGWPLALSVAAVLGLGGFFLRERLRVRRQQPAADATLLVRIDAEMAEQRRQHRLLSNVAVWYLGPCLFAGLILAGTVLAHGSKAPAVRGVAAAAFVVVFIFTYWAVMWVNRIAVRKVIEPRLQELEQWRKTLTSSE